MSFLTTAEEFNNFCQFLCQTPPEYIAIDTEFVRENTYWPQWSLLQIATPKETYIIDVIGFNKQKDFESFKNVLLQRSILKVFHACRQDIEIFLQELGVLPDSIFDCQIAASICGFNEGIGLAKLAYNLLGVEVLKTQQHTNWLIRPLSSQQLTYAAMDVQVIEQIFLMLQNQLDNLGRWGWLHEEQAPFSLITTYRPDGNDLWRRLKTPEKLKPAKRALLQELCKWREEKAQALNYNRAKVINDEMLIHLIRLNVENIIELVEYAPSLSPEIAEEIWSIMQAFAKRPSHTYPSLKVASIRPPYLMEAFTELSTLRNHIATKLGIAERLLGNNEALKDFISGQSVIFSQGWRYDVFGKEAEKILKDFNKGK